MFRFEEPTYLLALIVIPVLAIIYFAVRYQQKKRLRAFGDAELVRQLMPGVSRWRPAVKFWLLMTVLALLIVAWARPQFGTKISREKRTGIETIIAIDVSNSMLAEDVAPSRLDRAKMMVENLVDNFSNDKIGLIVFAGDAFIQLPITSDYVSAKMFLSNISPSMISTQGTDIAAAVNMASHSFTQQEGIGKAIIVITDGEDHEGGALEAARDAKEKGYRVYVLGIGSAKGAPIPIGNGDFLRDNSGQTVMTGLNEEMCRQVAQAGGGAYIHVENNSRAQSQLNDELSQLARKEIETNVYSDFDEQFQAVVLIALILLIAEVCILEIKNPRLSRLSLFSRGKKPGGSSDYRQTAVAVALLLVFGALSAPLHAQSDRQQVRNGNRLFRSGNMADAEVAYRKAMEQNSRNPQAAYNLGNAMMGQGKDSLAFRQLMDAARMENSPLRKAMAYHNAGVIMQQHRQYGEAIEAYKEALRNNPDDDETRYNLALCKKQQQQQQQQPQQGKKDQQQQDKKDDQQQQQQQQEKKENQQRQQQQQQQQQMSRETAEQLLNAAMQEERNTQDRMKKAQQQKTRRQLQHNW